jgi:hypothetical protein
MRNVDGTFHPYSRASVGALTESSLNELTAFGVDSTSVDALAGYYGAYVCTAQDTSGGIAICNSFRFLDGYPATNIDMNGSGASTRARQRRSQRHERNSRLFPRRSKMIGRT